MPIRKPEDVTGVSKLNPIQKGPQDNPSVNDGSGKSFASYMKEPLPTGAPPQTTPVAPAPFATPTPTASLSSIQQQTQMAQTTLGDLQTKLTTPKLKLDQSSKYLLNKKLSSAQTNIAYASTKLGVPLVPKEALPRDASPVNRFISLVSNGQNQLDSIQKELASISEKGDQLNPAEMLMIQVKLNKAQQQLEYSSIILSKAVDDIKQMMNTQI